MNALSQSILSSRVSTSAFSSSAKTSTSSRRGALQVMAASKKKDVRLQVTLECTEQREAGVQGMSRYITQKNRRNNSQRIELMKYNPYMKKHTLHRELKK
jgi:ribosomal protein L33